MDRRDEEMLIRAAMSARLPWLSPDAEYDMAYTMDTQEQIDQCCCCTMEYCVNCMGGGKHERRGRPRIDDSDSFAEMVKRGSPMSQICEALGIGKRTFYRYKSELIRKGALA